MSFTRVRRAVGALIHQEGQYLIVYKVKAMALGDRPIDIPGVWDLPKGGIHDSDEQLEQALLRELSEETGSNHYEVVRKYAEKIVFPFPVGAKYDGQETIMFEVRYTGDRSELRPQDEEIADIRWVTQDELVRMVELQETAGFIQSVIESGALNSGCVE